ncbi:DMT family transporter [Neotabrizicola shimadae]|uniref:DMT family transporter n=1 Tax=Neotabrizicola shimadae TaxID=2807096 RepID=A0A8G0ZYH0_9RHOB|nr:DMT family transporter [Neotabrizicola shimadae]QYZ71301.1 DMT family transporter [Neotabrizicola shimadae]
MTATTDRPIAGIAWSLVAGLLTVATNALIHAVGPAVPAVQAAFIRFALGALVLAPVLVLVVRRGLPEGVARPLALRAVVHALAVAAWFYALARLTPAESTAIGYLFPVAMMAGGVIFLGERLTRVRLWAVIIALAGAVVILRPGFAPISAAHLSMVAAALIFAVSYLIAKVLVRRLEPMVVVALLSASVALCLLPFAALAWIPVGGRDLALIAASAATATIGQLCMTRALKLAPVAVLQPVAFFQIIWATAATVMIFDEPVNAAVLVGAAMIVAAVAWAARVEAQARS